MACRKEKFKRGYRISTAEFIANAFIFYVEATGNRVLKQSKITAFIDAVLEDLEKQGHPSECFIDWELDLFGLVYPDYSAWWTEFSEGGENKYLLNNNIGVHELIHRFVGYLPLDVLKAFRNPNNTCKLL